MSIGSAVCTRLNPTVAMSPPQVGVAAGTTVAYVATITNNDTTNCSASTFDVSDAVPAGWAATVTSPALALSPGTTSTTTLQVTSPPTAPGGTYAVNATVKNRVATAFATSAAAAYVVSAATCTRANPTVTLSPLAAPGVAAGTPVSFTLSVTNRDSAACATSTFDLTSGVPSGWSASLGATSLALSAGASGSTTLQVTSSTAAVGGSYTANATAKNRGSTSSQATGSGTYVVTRGGSTTPGSFTDDFERADSAAIGAAWTVGVGSSPWPTAC